jgi:hypothetical protein
MKTMTCGQLGEPCDLALRGGGTADHVIEAQDRHLKDVVRGQDTAHESAHRDMKYRWKHPVASMGWHRDANEGLGPAHRGLTTRHLLLPLRFCARHEWRARPLTSTVDGA